MKTKTVPGKPGQWSLCKGVSRRTQRIEVAPSWHLIPHETLRFMALKPTGPLPDILNQICTVTRSPGFLVHFSEDYFELVSVSSLREITGWRKDLFGLTGSEVSV